MTWEDVRSAVEHREGLVLNADPVTAGSASTSYVVTTDSGRLFVKTVSDVPRAHVEVRVQRFLPPCAPAMRWKSSTGELLVFGFDYVAGRHVDLTPGSSDLPLVSVALSDLSSWERPDLPVLPIEKRWSDFSSQPLDTLAGDTLVHTDLCAENILIGDRTWIIDWAWPSRGAAWLDTASMVARLMQAGHSAAEAHSWGLTVPAFRSASPAAVKLNAEVRLALCRLRGYPIGDMWEHYLKHLDDA